VEAGAFVVEYTGEVITEKERLARMAAARQRGAVHFYIMELQKGMYIDAEHMGSKARFMNSSCEPNCETQKWKDAATGAHPRQHVLGLGRCW
jgi:SET domain-containing protein